MKTWRGGGGSQKSSKVVRGDYFSEVTFKEGGRRNFTLFNPKSSETVAALVKVFLLHDFTIVPQNHAKLKSFKTRDGVAGFTHAYYCIGPYCVKKE